MNTHTDHPQLWEELSHPFAREATRLKVQATSKDKKKGLVVPYVDARAVMDRLDEVVGPAGWSDQYERLGEGAVKCRLSILGIAKEDAGTGDDFKAACSDALKRAAVKFGIGRHLYDANKVWADLDERGNIIGREQTMTRVLGRPSGSSREPAGHAARGASGDGLPF